MLDPGKILPNCIAARAARTPARVFFREVSGVSRTYAELHEGAVRWADALRTAGVATGEPVVTMMAASAAWFEIWLGIATLGAVDAAVNTEYQGDWLHDSIERSSARVVIVDADLAGHLTARVLEGTAVERIVVVGGSDALRLAQCTESHLEFLSRAKPSGPYEPVQAWDTACMILTSGTTGPSKYVEVPWAQAFQGAMGLFDEGEIGPDDVLYSPLPVSHMAARYVIYRMALDGGTVVVRPRFSLGAFWNDVRAHGCTIGLIFAFSRMLWDQPPSERDREHPMRWVIMAPLLPVYTEFAERFGVKVRTGFGGTEIGVPIATRGDLPGSVGTCGRVLGSPVGIEARLVDEHDYPVAVGEVGELVVRTSEPWSLTTGYFGNPVATAAAWRNGWFHTGDGFKSDADGNLYFVDRIKDAIRRRGNNISSFEIEGAVNAHPGVSESAATAYPAADGEDEVRLFVVPNDSSLDAGTLAKDLESRLPRFMWPRYIEFVQGLPKTEATMRIKKHELRATPLPPDVWDRAG